MGPNSALKVAKKAKLAILEFAITRYGQKETSRAHFSART